MSKRRISVPLPHAGKKGVCVWCGNPLPPLAKRWCGMRCVTIYQVAQGDQGAARRWLAAHWDEWNMGEQRDCLPCDKCGEEMSRKAIRKRLAEHLDKTNTADKEGILAHIGSCWARAAMTKAERDGLRIRWEADHRKPICEGGDRSTANLRVLCRPCHVAETRALAARRAEARRIESTAEARS